MRIDKVIAVVLGLALAVASSGQTLSGRTSEKLLRLHIINGPAPLFPLDALRNRQHGVVVAQIDVDPMGHISAVRILEAPTPSMAESVSKALPPWQFRAFTSSAGQGMSMSGKLTFYFEIENRKGVVLNPSETGYVGRPRQDSRETSK